MNEIPTLLRGYPGEDISLPSIDEDWNAAAFHAGGILKRNGHSRVGLLMPYVDLAVSVFRTTSPSSPFATRPGTRT